MSWRRVVVAWLRVWLLGLGASGAGLAAPPAQPVDDSGTYVLGSMAWLNWNDVTPGSRSDLQSLQGQVQVALRLNTAAWQGRTGRLYMTLEPDGDSPVRLSWPASGPLREGRLSSGQRVLVFAGVLPGPWLATPLALHVRTGSHWRAERRRLRLYFDIEMD